MRVTNEQLIFFFDVAEEIVNHEEYQKLKQYKHHICMTRYEHCMHVAYRAYIKAVNSNKKVDLRSLIRGALLHDFYFYQREEAPKKHLKSHPLLSLENCKKYFELNKTEEDIIVSHMWPIGIKPTSKESWFVVKADKVSSLTEVVKIRQTILNELRILLVQYKLV